MIEFAPFLLIILGWRAERPGDIDLQRPEILFETREACEEAGAKMAARMTQAALDKSGAEYQHRCLAAPRMKEYDEAFERIKTRSP
ncbi:MAG: hypothetical protein QNI87_05105 [Erythrobacter sp.]|uniref:hypothetical protein n=1 Tax=Erythrobacter sp. TaxID=1042 RepID=UPI0026386AD6|nr:hypothetical protein [Erythrobacter sp.]MDJ0977895.1 hypothetical protein [Erythrobacter sp.]